MLRITFFSYQQLQKQYFIKKHYSIVREPLFDSIKEAYVFLLKKAHLQVTRCLLVVERPYGLVGCERDQSHEPLTPARA